MSNSPVTSIEMLKRLVAFDTTSRNSNLDLIKYIQSYLDDHGVKSTLVPNAEGTKANLFATIGPDAEGGIVLSVDSGDTTLDEGTTPLMRAARSGDAATMRLLLDAGADPMVATKEGTNALQFAAGVGYRDKNTKGTEAEALEALTVCVERGMDINQANSKGETALHGAASRGADSIVKYLVDHGAKLDAKTKRGFTPLDVAMGKDQFALPVPHDSTVALIRSLGGIEGGH